MPTLRFIKKKMKKPLISNKFVVATHRLVPSIHKLKLCKQTYFGFHYKAQVTVAMTFVYTNLVEDFI